MPNNYSQFQYQQLAEPVLTTAAEVVTLDKWLGGQPSYFPRPSRQQPALLFTDALVQRVTIDQWTGSQPAYFGRIVRPQPDSSVSVVSSLPSVVFVGVEFWPYMTTGRYWTYMTTKKYWNLQ